MIETAASQAAQLAAILAQRQMTVACAESCTGGGIAHAMTSIAGSSEWFWGSLVCYSLDAKQSVLKVPQAVLRRYGAVSEPTAIAMARGLLQVADVDLAVATTGIAGPGGGELLQPVGSVWFAWLIRTADGSEFQQTAVDIFEGDRAQISSRAVSRALAGLIAFVA